MKIIDREHKELMREEFLSNLALSEMDVMEDEQGEYVMVEFESEAGDGDYNIDFRVVRLPEELQSNFQVF